MTRKEIISLILLILVISYGTYKFVTREYTDTKSQFLLDTSVEISATSKSKDIGKHIDDTFALIRQLGDKFDEYKPDSWMWKVNHSTQTKIPIDADAYNMLCIADSLYRFTQGSYDVTIKPVFDLWQFDQETHIIPDSTVIRDSLKLVGFDKIKYDRNFLYKPVSTKLTFGSIAKGYILEQAQNFMKSNGVTSSFISCRSSIVFFNRKIPEMVYVKHPRGANDDYIASFKIADKSIGTSGDYQQFFEIDGKRYHHILNAHTGYPVENTYSVTIVTPSCAWADGLSTALFSMEPNQAIEQIKKFPDSNAVIYYNSNNTIVALKTVGMKNFDYTEK